MKRSKHPKRAVRRRYNRRRKNVRLILADLKEAAENVLTQRGSVYKKEAELEALIAEIDRFVGATGLTPPPLPEVELEFDLFKMLEQQTDEPSNGSKI
jgi:hypothetical protein